MRKIILIGVPGAGKDEQTKLLEKNYGIPNISSGAIIRASNDPEMIHYKKYVYPLLLEDKLLFKLMDNDIPKGDVNYMLNGFVRTLPQAEYAIKKNLANITLYLKVSDEVATERLLKANRGRKEDNPEDIKRRLTEFHEITEPAINFLRKNSEFYEIDGSGPVEEVNDKIIHVLGLK